MKRLYSLDVARGAAALIVVLGHWQSFSTLYGQPDKAWTPEAQPLFLLLRPFYLGTQLAVELFFVLSGYVFYWLYSRKIAESEIRFSTFLGLRASRLYPLNWLTVLVVFCAGSLFHLITGRYFFFPLGDVFRFVSALFLTQQWLPPTTTYYLNGPAWSVSVEVLVYLIFFAVCRVGMRGVWPATAIAVTMLLALHGHYDHLIERGLLGFFVGGVVWHLCERLKKRDDAATLATWLGRFAALIWLLLIAEAYLGWVNQTIAWAAGHISPTLAARYLYRRDVILMVSFSIFVAPITIAALALQEQLLGRGYRALSFFGDISYSVYLLHFPLLLLCALAAVHYGWQPIDFLQGWVMVAFFFVLITLSAISHYAFEMPAQKWLRKLLMCR